MQLALNLPTPLAAREALFLDHDQPFTTSRAVAERFGKRHTHVLRAIEQLLSDIPDPAFSQPNFGPAEYLDAQKKPRVEYRLSHDGFALLAMGFTGTQALAWKIAFIQAFNALEVELRARIEREAAALHTLRPVTCTVAERTEAGLNRSAIAFEVDRTPNSITYHRRSARRLGLLPQRAA
jgi:Rha family phage regulatory protein